METQIGKNFITFIQGVWSNTRLYIGGDNKQVKVVARGMLCQPVELILDKKEIQQLRTFLNNLEEQEKTQQEPIVTVEDIVAKEPENAMVDWF